jgi:hypothetical protein
MILKGELFLLLAATAYAALLGTQPVSLHYHAPAALAATIEHLTMPGPCMVNEFQPCDPIMGP